MRGMDPWREPGDEVVVSGGGPYDPTSVAVYRFYNDTGALLYVGIASSPKARFAQHTETKRWWWEVATWLIDWYGSREEAAAVEAISIVQEKPAYNIAGAPDIQPDRMITHWTDCYTRQRPVAGDLNYFYLWKVRMQSLGVGARVAWHPDDAAECYRFVVERARPGEIRKHEQYVDRLTRKRSALCLQRDERRRRSDVAAAASAAARRQAENEQNRDLLTDVLAALGDDDTARAADLPPRLRRLAPNCHRYKDLNGTRLAELLRAAGVAVRLHGGCLTVRRERVKRALDARTRANKPSRT